MAITISTGFDLKTNTPLDGRMVVENKDDITTPYAGLTVYEKEKEQYYICTSVDSNNKATWKQIVDETLLENTTKEIATINDTIKSGTVNAANKLATARNIALTGAVTGTATFNGASDVSISTLNRRTVVGSSATGLNYWYKVASINVPSKYQDRSISFKVTNGIQSRPLNGILKAHVRSQDIDATETEPGKKPLITFEWEYANFQTPITSTDQKTLVQPEDFKFIWYYKKIVDENGIVTGLINYPLTCEIWVKIREGATYTTYHFEVLSEHSLGNTSSIWTLHNSIGEMVNGVRDNNLVATDDELKERYDKNDEQCVTSTLAFISNASAINDKAVTKDKLAEEAVDTSKLVDSAIIESKINDNAVTTNKIKNSSITTDKINDKAVTKDKLAEEVTQLLDGAFDFKGGITSNETAGEAPTWPDGITTLHQGDVFKISNDGWFYNTYCTTGDTVFYVNTVDKVVSAISKDDYLNDFLVLETNIDITSTWPGINTDQDSKIGTIGAVKDGIKTAGTKDQAICKGDIIGSNNAPVYINDGVVTKCDAPFLNIKYIWFANYDMVAEISSVDYNLLTLSATAVGTLHDFASAANVFTVMSATNATTDKNGVVTVKIDLTASTVNVPQSGSSSFSNVFSDAELAAIRQSYTLFNNGDLLVCTGVTGAKWKRIPMYEAKSNLDGLMSAGDKVNLTTLLDRYVADGNDNHNSGNCITSGLYGNITLGRPATTDDGIHWNMMSVRNEPNNYTSQLFMSNDDRMFYRGKNSTDSANSSEVLLAHKANTIGYITSILNWTTSAGIFNDLDSSASNNKIDGSSIDYSVLCTGTGQLAIGNSNNTAGRLFARYSPGSGAGNASAWSQIVRIPTTKDSNNNTICAAVGGPSKPVYIAANGAATACTGTYGSATKHMYINNGIFTTSSSTIGKATTPMYMSSGTFKACSGSTVTFSPIGERGTSETGEKIYLAGMYLTDDNAKADTFSNNLDIATPYEIDGIENSNGVYISTNGHVLFGAAWNDYAEYRACTETIEPGRVVCENGDDTVSMSTERLQPGALVVSDTFGFAIGQTKISNTPIAVAGRVLAYPYEDRDSYKPGDAVCAGPNGTVSKMTREEIKEYPERIIGTVSAIPAYETWGTNNVSVNGRIWIKI